MLFKLLIKADIFSPQASYRSRVFRGQGRRNKMSCLFSPINYNLAHKLSMSVVWYSRGMKLPIEI